MRFPVTAKMSSKGQVVIPEVVRKQLRLEPGTPFLVVARGDTVVLHRLKEPPWKAFEELATQAQEQGQHFDAAMLGFQKAINKIRRGR